jgi:phosphoserine phosphatase
MYRLFAFDVDGTLIASRDGRVVWQLLNQRFGSDPEQDGRLFKAYLGGHITYAEWVDLDIGRWVQAGATRPELEQVIQDHLFPVPGAREALAELKARGQLLAVISGTLDLTLSVHFPSHPFDEVFTNRIWFDEAGLIDGWEATPYDMEGKARALRGLSARLGVPLEQTAYVGDNINDIQVMEAAGLAVAFEPKHDTVRDAASAVVEGDMRGLLDLPQLAGL